MRRIPSLMKLLFEQDEMPNPAGDEESVDQGVSSSPSEKKSEKKFKSKELMGKMNLESLMSNMRSNQKEVLAAALTGDKDGNIDDQDKLDIVATGLPVESLRPTQNEVVIEKSLPYTLTNPKSFKNMLTTNGPQAVGKPGENDAIVTLNGKYVIDGHHRWSALFCFNPGASIQTFDIQAPDVNPSRMLKAAQVSIWSAGNAPPEPGGGVNLFKASKKDIKNTVDTYVTDELAAQFIELLKDPAVADTIKNNSGLEFKGGTNPKKLKDFLSDYIDSNVRTLKTKTPIANATARPFMPQTDKVGPVSQAAGTPKGLEALAQGKVDILPPFANESIDKKDLVVLERWNRLAGLLKD